MKKHVIRAAVLLAALAAVFLACGLWYARGAAPLTTGDIRMRFQEGQDFIHAAGQIDEDGMLEIGQTFYLTNRTGVALGEIVLRLYANGSCVAVPESASINGEECDALLDEEDATLLRIARPWAEGEEIELTLSLSIAADPSAQIAVIPLPVLAQIQDGQWRTEPWDALAGTIGAPAMDGYLDILCPEELSVVFSGEAGHLGAPPGSQKGVRSIMAHTESARGMILAVSGNACVRWRAIGGVAVSAMAENVLQANRLLDCAQAALESLDAIGLDYPFPSLSIVGAQPVSADGDVYSALIVPGTQGGRESLVRRMTRLIARQTFGVSAGYDPWNEPWLSHTLASAAELLAYRQRRGETAYETRFFEEVEVATRLTRPYGVTVGAGIDRFGSDAEMTQVLRDQGGAMMMGIGEAIGHYDVLAHALYVYAQDAAGGMGSRQSLEAALESVSGIDWTGYLNDELSY